MAKATTKWKERVIAEYRSGVSVGAIAQKVPVSRRTIYYWVADEGKVVPLSGKKKEAIA